VGGSTLYQREIVAGFTVIAVQKFVANVGEPVYQLWIWMQTMTKLNTGAALNAPNAV
jgi:hypothetical protein